MNNSKQIRIESLGANPVICVLRDQQGRSLGTGSREILEVLLYIAEQCDQTTPWRKTTAHRPQMRITHQADS